MAEGDGGNQTPNGGATGRSQEAESSGQSRVVRFIMFLAALASLVTFVVVYQNQIIDISAEVSLWLYNQRGIIGAGFGVVLLLLGAAYLLLRWRRWLPNMQGATGGAFGFIFVVGAVFLAIVAFGNMDRRVTRVEVALFDYGDVSERRVDVIEQRLRRMLPTRTRYELSARTIPSSEGTAFRDQLQGAADDGAEIFLINAQPDAFEQDVYDKIADLDIPTIWLQNASDGADFGRSRTEYDFSYNPWREARALASTLAALDATSIKVIRRNGDTIGERFYDAFRRSIESRLISDNLDGEVYDGVRPTTPDINIEYDALVIACFSDCDFAGVQASLDFPAPRYFFTTGFANQSIPENLDDDREIFVSTPFYARDTLVAINSDDYTNRRVYASISLVDQIASQRPSVRNRDFRALFDNNSSIYLSNYGFVSLNGNSINYSGVAIRAG